MSKKTKNNKDNSGTFKQILIADIPALNQLVNTKTNTRKFLENTQELSNKYSPIIKPITNKLISFPCYSAKLYAHAICNPVKMIDNSIGQLINVIQTGGNKYKNHYYNYIYDPIDKKYYHILSKKGKTIILGYIGKLLTNNL